MMEFAFRSVMMLANNSLFSGVAGGTGARMIASSFMKLMTMKVAFWKP